MYHDFQPFLVGKLHWKKEITMTGIATLDGSKLVAVDGITPPQGSQNSNTIVAPDTGSNTGITVINGNGPFSIWLAYVTDGVPATMFNIYIDGVMQGLQPNVYPKLSAQEEISFQWQVDPGQVIRFVWIFLSGC